MRRIGIEERRARLVRRHLLDPSTPAQSLAEIAEALGALHATDSSTVYLSVRARSEGLDPPAIERELYDERTVVRMLGMRRTLFVVPRDARPIVQRACTDDVAARERTRLAGWLAKTDGIDDAGTWLAEAEAAALAAVEAAGEATTADVIRSVPFLATKIEIGAGKWTLPVSVGSRVLPLLAAQGRLLRGRPRGTWISGQHHWVPTSAWLGEEQPLPTVEGARAELVRRWLRANGPGTEVDLRWWAGLGARPIRTALAEVGAVEVDLDGATGLVLADDLEEVEPPTPCVALLSTLDTTTMAWKEREWYLGGHGPTLFDRNGNAGPTIWWDGRVVGGWSQRRDGEVVYRLLEDVGSEAEDAVQEEAARLAAWMGEVRISPGFLPPFQRELAT